MTTIPIPKKVDKNEDLIAIPRKEYEVFLRLQGVKEFTPTPAQKKALLKAEKDFRQGKSLSYNELVKKLEFRD